MPRIGERQHEPSDLRLPKVRPDLLQLHIAIMRTLVIPPAHVQPYLLAWNVRQRRIDRRHDAIDEAEEVAERAIRVGHVPLHREIRTIELQKEPGFDYGLVFHP